MKLLNARGLVVFCVTGLVPGCAMGTLDREDSQAAPEDTSSKTPSEPFTLPEGLPEATPTRSSSAFPFPQNQALADCTSPESVDSDDVQAAFDAWKERTVTADGADGALRVQRLPTDPMISDETDDTVSEGIGYGMLIAVYMDDQELFDQLWRYEQKWVDPETGLMHWHINAAGTTAVGTGPASDADEDMAWALLMADKQWGGKGSLDEEYLAIARKTINQIWQYDVLEGKLFIPGPWGSWDIVNISYFTPSYYRAFSDATGNTGWLDVVNTSYNTLQVTVTEDNENQDNGLIPAWSRSTGQPNAGVWGPTQQAPTNHQYDSCRTPFRIGLDYCFNAEPRALEYVAKISSFYAGIGVENMTDGYELDGTPKPEFDGLSAAFVGPAAVGAMASGDQASFVEDAYAALKNRDLLVGGEYYDLSWTVLSLLMLSGNFLDYTQMAAD